MAMSGALKGRSYFDKNVPDIVLRSLFMKYDKDGSQQLNKEELSGLFQNDLGLNKEQAESYAYLLDKDGNGKVSFEEFRSWLNSGERFKNVNDKSRYHRLRKAVEMFKNYDKDGSGALDREEFKKLFTESGGKPKNLEAALKELDQDNNGLVSFQEFLKWLNWVPLEKW